MSNWHVEAERLKARFPYKPWSEICSLVAKRPRKAKPKQPSVSAFTSRMEQMKLF